MSEPRVLAVETDPQMLGHMRDLCRRWKVALETAEDAESGLRRLSAGGCVLVVAGMNLRGTTGLELLRRIKRRHAEVPVVLVSDHPEVAEAVRAMKSGASDYLDKPVSRETLELSLTGLLDSMLGQDGNGRGGEISKDAHGGSVEESIEGVREEGTKRAGASRLLTSNRIMKRAVRHALSLADVRAPVLLEGETGVGKSLLAEEIHRNSRRRGPFVQVTCTSLAEYLLASELFGHVRGAFSGASRDREGKLEAANGGVVFVDGIAEASLALQRRLLRVLEDGVVERVGEGRPIPVDMKMVVASNRDLAELVWEGKFCEPLYHRLNVARVKVPPLRHRKDDIGLLAEMFLAKFRERNERGPKAISEECLKELEEYGWPGNVGELEGVVSTAASLCPEGVEALEREHLPRVLSNEPVKPKRPTADGMAYGTSLSHLLEERERVLVEQALAATDYNVQYSAKLLEISRPTLYAKMKRYGLARE